MHWLSIIPFLVIIPIAVWTKQVVPALGAGLIVGAYVVHPSIFGGFRLASQYFIHDLANPTNLYVLGFLYIFGGLVQWIKETGGIRGFTAVTTAHIRTRRQLFGLMWATAVGTFSAPVLRIVTVAPLGQALEQRVAVKKSRLSFLIEGTGLPVTVLMPAGTSYIGYMIATIALSLHNAHRPGNAYHLLLASLPYNLFALLGLLLAVGYTVFGHPRPSHPDDDAASPSRPKTSAPHTNSPNLPTRPFNLYVPLATAVAFTFFLPWWAGYQRTHAIIPAFFHTNVAEAMFVGIVLTLVLSLIFFLIQLFSLRDLMTQFFQGGNQLMEPIAIFALAWALASVSEQLGLAPFVTRALGWVPGPAVAPAVFVLGSLLAYVLGTSFGAWALIMPIGVSLAPTASVSLPVLIGAVFATGTFGELTSPFSGDTVTMAGLVGLDTVAYARYKLIHSLIPFGLAAMGYLAAGLLHL